MRISFPISPHEPFSPFIRDIFHAEKVNAVARGVGRNCILNGGADK